MVMQNYKILRFRQSYHMLLESECRVTLAYGYENTAFWFGY